MTITPRREGFFDALSRAKQAAVEGRLFVGAHALTEVGRWHFIGEEGEPGFYQGWGNLGGAHADCAYFLDPRGIVFLRGLAATTGSVFAEKVFWLPEALFEKWGGISFWCMANRNDTTNNITGWKPIKMSAFAGAGTPDGRYDFWWDPLDELLDEHQVLLAFEGISFAIANDAAHL